MDTSELKRMRELEDEKVKPQKMFADVSLQNQAMKEIFAKELVTAEKKAWRKQDAAVIDAINNELRFCFRVINIIDSEIQLIIVLVDLAAIFRTAILENSQHR